MISKSVYDYCKDDISLIENYDKAINSNETYDCHHKLEIELNMSPNELKEKDLYFQRPASELIFLTKSEHISLHRRGKSYGPCSEETKQKISKNSCMKDPIVRAKVSSTLMGHIGANLGKHRVYREDGSFYMSY